MGLSRSVIDVSPLRTSAPFRRLWAGQTLSGLGGQMTLVAVMFQVWDATRSTVWTGAVGLAQAVPLVALGLFAGALVDRVDRRTVYLVTITGQTVCAVLLAVQAVLEPAPVALVLALVALESCCSAAGGPASRTFVPELLPEHQVAAGLALRRISFQGAMLLGPALGGLLVGAWGTGACYAIDALTFAA
ncbi:MFS transporter, partial [Streptomyces sp. SID5785]|uniref:MFS transporter n=1 Tax=Streptomyces sp. SID5785 TaxID=2690309 RepID=UPI001361BE73|nr:MFS transporter [Streptomyces sp. SID5785]